MSRKNRAKGNSAPYQGGYNVGFGGDGGQTGGFNVGFGGDGGQTGGYDVGFGYQDPQQGTYQGDGGYYIAPMYDASGRQMDVASQQQEMSGGRKVFTFLGRSITITLKYFAAKALICIIMGAAAWLIFRFLKIPYAGILGIVLAIGNFIPIIGEWAAAAIICLPLLFSDPKLALYAAITLVGLEAVDDFVLTPIIVGKSLSFKPIIVLLVTIAISIAGGTFFGVLFAIPVIAIVKLFLDIFWFKKSMDNTK